MCTAPTVGQALGLQVEQDPDPPREIQTSRQGGKAEQQGFPQEGTSDLGLQDGQAFIGRRAGETFPKREEPYKSSEEVRART